MGFFLVKCSWDIIFGYFTVCLIINLLNYAVSIVFGNAFNVEIFCYMYTFAENNAIYGMKLTVGSVLNFFASFHKELKTCFAKNLDTVQQDWFLVIICSIAWSMAIYQIRFEAPQIHYWYFGVKTLLCQNVWNKNTTLFKISFHIFFYSAHSKFYHDLICYV